MGYMHIFVTLLCLSFYSMTFAETGRAEEPITNKVSVYETLASSPMTQARLNLFKASVERLIHSKSLNDSQVKSSEFAFTFDAAFDVDLLIEDVQDRLEFELEKEEVETLLTWHQRPLGRQLLEAEQHYINQNLVSKNRDFSIAKYKTNVLRKGHFRQLDSALGFTRVQVEFLESMHNLLEIILTNQFGTNPYLSQLNQFVGILVTSSRQFLGGYTESLFAHVYRDISNQDLNHYSVFLKLKSVRLYNKVINDVVRETLLATIAHSTRKLLKH